MTRSHPGLVLLEQLSRGDGPTVVFRARDGDGAIITVKALRPEARGHADAVYRFRNEAVLLATLGGRHHLVRAIREIESPPELVLEFLSGLDLKRRIHPRGGVGAQLIPLADTLRIAADVGDALSHLHRHDVVHRDVKSSNVLFSASGEASLADLGVAATGNPSRGLPDGWIEEQVGTLGYAAPELLQEPVSATPATDVHGLAATLYEALTGRLPYMLVGDEDDAALRRRILAGEGPIPIGSVAAVKRSVAAALMQGLAPSPVDRFQTIAEFLAALAPVVL